MKKMLLLILLLVFPSLLFSQNYAAAIKMSTIGISVEGYRSFGDQFNARLGASLFSYSYDSGIISGEDYKFVADLSLASISALADWFPFESSSFRLSGGLFINLNTIDVTATPTVTRQVGGDTYGPEELGDLYLDLRFNKVAPYLGFGFGNPTAGESGLGFTFDVGTFYQGAPAVDMRAYGLLEPSADQGPLIEENLNWFKWYPIFSLGLTYKF
ncbi:MAG: hypothetical protein K9J16_15995 [Melioribacteraceae bacterium]|nr:hypothetical protein [Melioribacteraceae bacterium]MCF8356136.1 hypothetical protein [Melioribacteraceae bacterium]MCF8395484.1 hypothetical protein [Melioribacteraceae bacterium]MCF8420824.1 hypothetical protein [Melioribacteraceae bacterium]